MKLSVIIVNYNVKYFLEQCLHSVYAAAEGIDTEVWVVDNNSTDGSVQMLRERFPMVHLIANSDNPGFAKANNQALRECTGDYVLLLNPDTVVQRDTFTRCIAFFESHAECGGLSVKMVNGEGEFLKESKRGFPSPKTSFYKITGLIKLFPHNKTVGAYYMGHLSDDETCEVDVLPGAFIMISRPALDKTGLLDESYFMYGEDIDWSWRIRLSGYKNYYLPETRILHYKGESTKKGSMNYVYTFYNAMGIFVKKYYGGKGARRYNLLLQLAIWLRASLDFLKRMLGHLAMPAVDFVVSLAGLLCIKQIWATYWAENVNYYPNFYSWGILPLYVLILLMASWLSGGYDKPVKTVRIVQGIGLGALCLLVFYSLMDETLRFSRAIILFGSLWSIVAALCVRGLLGALGVAGYSARPESRRRYLIVGSDEEQKRITELFGNLGIEPKEVAAAPAGISSEELRSRLAKGKVDELIFSGADVAVSTILDHTVALRDTGVYFRIAPKEMDVLIGSNYTNSPEELYHPDHDDISSSTNRRNKRLFDLVVSVLLLALTPLLFWFQKRKRRYLSDILSVLTGRRSWVGYSQQYDTLPMQQMTAPLPHLRKGIFRTTDSLPPVRRPNGLLLDQQYAQDYHVITDLTIVMKNIRKI